MHKQQEVREFLMSYGIVFDLSLPKDCEILKVVQKNKINRLYVLGTFHTGETETRHFQCYETLDQIYTDMETERIYIDSFVSDNRIVYHLFEIFR